LKARLYLRFNLVLVLAASAMALPILAAAKVVWSLPKPLLLVLGGIFVICSAPYAWLAGRLRNPVSFSTLYKHAITLLGTWALVAALFLGAIYRLDRAGWLWTQVTGYNVTLPEDYSDRIFLTLERFVQRYPFFIVDPQDTTQLILPKGSYQFRETIVIPEGTSLVIEPGAILRFGVGRSLVSYSPIIAKGSVSDPIIFAALHPWLKWGAVGVIKAEKSLFDYVRFENGRQAFVNGADFFGGLSLIETESEITNSQFMNMFGRDAVYVNRGSVLVRNNIFYRAYKDCIDFDGGRGEISSNIFVNCGDEAVDLSANFDIDVFSNQVLGPGGGRMDADNNLDKIISLNEFIDIGGE
jgi:hypothetical protein